MRVGILTGGGDCPGLNPAIRGAVLRGLDHGFEFVGLRLGWKGLVEGLTTGLPLEKVEDIVRQGGTILSSSRTNPFNPKDPKVEECLATWIRLNLDALIAIGGDDTLTAAKRFHHEHGLNVVGVPKTMDNDLDHTDYTFGFDTAAGVALDAADRLLDTARSHHRILVLEVMGRYAGWVALHVGIGAGADWICIPEVPVNFEEMIATLKRKRDRGKHWGLVVVSEAVKVPVEELSAEQLGDRKPDAFGHVPLGGIVGEFMAKRIEAALGIETRVAVLGHVQRGGSPSLFDRFLGTRVGVMAADLVKEGRFGMMAALHGTEIVAVKLSDAVGTNKQVPPDMWPEVLSLINK